MRLYLYTSRQSLPPPAPLGQAMALRVWKVEQLTPLQAQTRLRRGIFDAIQGYMATHALSPPTAILEMGCSVGVGSRWLAAEWPQAQLTALDLSPFFLAVAELRERQCGGGSGARRRIRYLHANMEDTGLPPASFDMVAVQFVIHECPAQVIANLVSAAHACVRRVLVLGYPGGVGVVWMVRGQEGCFARTLGLTRLGGDAPASCHMHRPICGAPPPPPLQVAESRRLLKPGGVLTISDNNPRSKVIQNLPPVLFTLMKSTEP
jgi:SAM-dependent methyltransferase